MFSGIIKEKGTVKFINNGVLSIVAEIAGKNAYIGQSIAVNGLCLTVKKINYPVLFFDFTPETYRSSALKYLRISEKVNIESALSVGSDISGHFVLGHVDGIGRIVVKKRVGNSIVVGIKIVDSIDGDIDKYIIKKGSISVDGISLTVNELKGDIFFVSVIPLTYDETNLKFKAIYDYVNLESDIIEKTVAIRMNDKAGLYSNKGEKIKGSLTYEFLVENGFK
ncbi:riboflavin synthase [Candidatus Acidulodesulfobacterium sp. H_13]|uniref:riboflavin synthase n=1 Tax=Candidatus Acidulodesulfobacterium sp. H_13 TaxID=3395470 RepID=UPI003AF45FC0